jgi:hypothetical protein
MPVNIGVAMEGTTNPTRRTIPAVITVAAPGFNIIALVQPNKNPHTELSPRVR